MWESGDQNWQERQRTLGEQVVKGPQKYVGWREVMSGWRLKQMARLSKESFCDRKKICHRNKMILMLFFLCLHFVFPFHLIELIVRTHSFK